MSYVTSIERLAQERGEAVVEARGEARGEIRGEARGRASVVLKLLMKFCGGLSEQQEKQLFSLSAEQLDQLAEDLLQFQSLADFEKWLQARG